MPNSLLQFFVRELHNSMVSPPEEGGLKEARDEENNIIISDSTLQNIISPQLKNMTSWYKIFVSVSVSYLPRSYIHHYYHGVRFS